MDYFLLHVKLKMIVLMEVGFIQNALKISRISPKKLLTEWKPGTVLPVPSV